MCRNRIGTGIRRLGFVGLAPVLLAATSAVGAATVEEVEKDLVRKQAELKSYTAVTETKTDMDLGQGNRSKSETKGTMEWAKKGDKVLYRMESKGTSIVTVGGSETKTKMNSTTVCDGQFVYTLAETDGRKMAFKSKVDPAQGHDAKAVFDLWRKDYTLKVGADEKIDGKDCYAIEATPKKKEPNNPVARQRFWFRKDLATMVKMVGYGKDDKPAITNTVTEIKPNAEIKPERFKFELPPGVELMDATKTQAGAGEESKTGPKTEQKPKAAEEKASKPEEKKGNDAAKNLLRNLVR